jgi:hypothetical protein
VIYRKAVIGEREESTAIKDWHAAQPSLALDDQTPTYGENRRQMGQEQTRQRVRGAKRNRQILPSCDKMWELDWRLDSDYHTVRPVVTYHPRINFISARKAFSRCRLRPVAQHALDQTPLYLGGRRCVGFGWFMHAAKGTHRK